MGQVIITQELTELSNYRVIHVVVAYYSDYVRDYVCMLMCAHVCKMAYACTLLHDSIQSDNNNTW